MKETIFGVVETGVFEAPKFDFIKKVKVRFVFHVFMPSKDSPSICGWHPYQEKKGFRLKARGVLDLSGNVLTK